MFGDFGKLAGLMTKLPKIREEMEKLQERLVQISAEGQAGGGMVTVKVNGKFVLLACQIQDEALKMQDRELLEDLIVAASNQAMERVKQLIAEETGRLTSELGLPPGLNLPGLS